MSPKIIRNGSITIRTINIMFTFFVLLVSKIKSHDNYINEYVDLYYDKHPLLHAIT